MRARLAAVFVSVSLLAVLPSIVPAARAQDDGPWRVKGRLVGKVGDKSENVSGIACQTSQAFPRTCVVIDDERQEAQFVTIEDGELKAGKSIPLITDSFGDKPLDFDGEGVTFADGFYYVIGSHGHPRDRKRKLKSSRDDAEINARIAASSRIIRFRDGAAEAVTPTARLRQAIAADPTLRRFLDRRLENNGVTIEGIAIRQGRLLAGFRGPTLDDGCAAILSVSLAALFGNGNLDAVLHRLRLGDGQGVRDLAVYENGILVLSGPTDDGPGSYAVYWWDGESPNVRQLKELSSAISDPEHKPEAILPLDKGKSGIRLLVLSDGAKEGRPVAVDIPEP
ncbi:DUF3616 domain-containing protein [Bradyrhizobium liaoningense]|uniref:DUF3616 domain-containing protein n=1 Tax=Bradyrhizobium liaoningense TaxID=43992 RepID=UPI0009DAB4BE|nr:DUF3616 domain-containing protein [Bradyrhizobium liaoningense]